MAVKDVSNKPLEVEAGKKSKKRRLLIRDLGWSRKEALETHYRLESFKEDWDAPGMEAYDEL